MHAPPSSDIFDSEGRLTEYYVQDAFHTYLKSSLSQAKAERLLDVEVLSSAEGDLMITGPALCLYFAALRCTTNPPSVPLPRQEKSGPKLDLSLDNCPHPFTAFLTVWSQTVPAIQALIPEHQHDLARVICGLPPVAQPVHRGLSRIAADLRSVAIEVSQRRSFQDRYATDLQAAIDTGADPAMRAKASFVPPPEYTPSPTASDFSGHFPPSPHGTPAQLQPGPSSRDRSRSRERERVRTPSLVSASSPAIELIRETLYAALGDVLAQTPSLRPLLARDPPRAYFGAVALAILQVARTAITPDGSVRGVLGENLTLGQCPPELRPLMLELGSIGHHANEMEEEDTEEAMRRAQRGQDIDEPRLERVRAMLEAGAGRAEEANGRRSVEGRAIAFANRVNGLALNMTRLKAFRDRQDEVFKATTLNTLCALLTPAIGPQIDRLVVNPIINTRKLARTDPFPLPVFQYRMEALNLDIQTMVIEAAYMGPKTGILDYATMRACALVCRAWSPTAQRLLFRHIDYENRFGDARRLYPGVEKIPLLIRSLRSRPLLATYVRYVAVAIWSYPENLLEQQIELLDLCPFLEGICALDVRSRYQNTIADLRLRAIPSHPVLLAVEGQRAMVRKIIHIWPNIRTLIVHLGGEWDPIEIAEWGPNKVPRPIPLPPTLQSLIVTSECLDNFELPEDGLGALRALGVKSLDSEWCQQPRASGLLRQLRTLKISGHLPSHDVLDQLENLVHLVFGTLPMVAFSLPQTLHRVGYHSEAEDREDDMGTAFFLQALRALEHLQLVTSTRWSSTKFLATLSQACSDHGVEFVIYDSDNWSSVTPDAYWL
ncbi:hypothetical protein FA95DRAFT_1608906 [Auriscalpium vulgare]|uniref:Uncharacterized protein n=1 Tax=Auriscalpium vulgare TaxID=40419 RepID=A0ACB8RIQ6_9AGAM|nr:hypothetical protein FA95DRAFT_1608906 [Auriscalpium vulgare]